MIPERLVRFRLRTVLSLLGTIIAVAVVLEVIWIARHVLTWILIALFLALALNPAVEWFQRHGLKRRGAAAGAPGKRRARAAERRVQADLGGGVEQSSDWKIGEEIGWQIRFERRFTDAPRLLVATEGVLTARSLGISWKKNADGEDRRRENDHSTRV